MSKAALLPRVLKLEGGHNFREVGGYPTALGGARLRRGQLWRSAALDQLSINDCALLDTLGLRAIADLRGIAERQRAPTAPQFAAGARTLVWSRNASPSWGRPETGDWSALSKDSLRAEIGRLYVRITDTHGDALRDLVKLIAAGGAPVLIHCTAGKDRTGLIVALLLELAGVAREWTVWDYEQTAHHLDRSRVDLESVRAIAGPMGLDGLGVEAEDMILGVDRSYLGAAFNSLEERFGSVEGFARGPLALSDAALAGLRKALIEPL
jgi:protein-tyrosine phosphatase